MGYPADSLVRITGVYNFKLGDKEYSIIPNEQGFISHFIIVKKIQNPEEFYSELSPGKEDSKLTINIKSGIGVVDELKSDFQYLESSIAFMGSYTKIRWENPIQEWIPETEEEKSKLKIIKLEHKKIGYPQSALILPENDFKEMILDKPKYDSLTILQAFYNDSNNFYNDFKYINAFYNYYFVIEDIYGGNNTQNRLIKKSFKNSTDLKNNIKWVIDTRIKPHKKHNNNITNFLKDMNLTDTVDDIIDFLIDTRGRLHHFSRKSTLKIGTPFNQSDYESVAYLASGIALRSILGEILKINLQYQTNENS